MRVSSCPTVCGHTKRVLRAKSYSASSRITSEQGIIVILFANVGITFATVLTIALVCLGDIVVAALPTDSSVARRYLSFLETVLLQLYKDGLADVVS